MFFEFDFDAMLNDRINEVSEFSPSEAEALEFGATTIIGILSNASGTLDLTDEQNEAISALFDAAQPHIDRLREATIAAQVNDVDVEDEEEETEVEETEEQDDEAKALSAVDDLIEGLFASFLGAEAAAEIRAQVEAEDARKAEAVEDETTPEQEVEDFLAALFGVRV